MEQYKCGPLQRSILVFAKRFQDKINKSSKELFIDATSDSHEILDSCSLFIHSSNSFPLYNWFQ